MAANNITPAETNRRRGRYNAARSLMLPRSNPGRRIPLWLQRLRASDLLQIVGKHTEFPVVIETYRECLQDVFDLAGLKDIIADMAKGHIRLQQVGTSLPSPMAAGILFKFVSVHLYEMDQSRQPGEGLGVSSELIHSILDQQTIPALNRALQQLADKGLIGCENYPAFAKIFESAMTSKEANAGRSLPTDSIRPSAPGKRRRQTKKSDIRKMIQDRSRIIDGRWFLTTSPAIMGKPVEYPKLAELQARLLLHRYGILVKEWYRRERGLLPWYQIFQMLKRLEWQGEIRRGYFVAGLSGLQFALPEALELLAKITSRPACPKSRPLLLSSLDPALPFGGGIDWGVVDSGGIPQKIIRSVSNHLMFADGRVILVCERYFQRLFVLDDFPRRTWELLTRMLLGYLRMPYPLKPGNRIEIQTINNHPAAASPYAEPLLKTGFEKDGAKLVLWLSAIAGHD